VGVECDEPVGKNDGSVKGKRYFSCEGVGGMRGLFVRPERVTVGDYPVLDELGMEEDEEI
jgi:tubulin-folding cofactor B